MTTEVLRLGTRASPLALVQTRWVADQLRSRLPGLRVEVVEIRTTGDRIRDRPLAEIGGKGLFIKEIEEAMLDGRVDAGVHSMKDLPGTLPPGLGIAAVPEREVPDDVLVAERGVTLEELSPAARIGTGSLRRMALLRALRPDVEVVPMRGNVGTRLGKWRSGEVDGVVLAASGMIRLGIDLEETRRLDPERFVPAIGQGALAIEASLDSPHWAVIGSLEHLPTRVATDAERGFLTAVAGDCKTPIAAHATVVDGHVDLRAVIADPEGRSLVEGARSGASADAASIGATLAEELLSAGGAEILDRLGIER